MALPHHYLLALISPFGRLGQAHFALLACLIAFAHLYIYAKMAGMPSDEPWNVYSIALLVMIWCKFCILSRRLHDTGSNGLIAIPVLLISVGLYLYIIDPSIAGDAANLDAGTQWVLEQGMRVPRALFIAAFIYCIRAGGETGPNAYGPEFGDSGDVVEGARASLDKKQDSTMPQHGYKIFREEDSGWGQRRRPTGFGRR
jgi:uncharacterized membrane protein YhaH (DUF805 family)